MDRTTNDCFQLGEIRRLHGVAGEVIIFIDADDPSRYTDLDAVLIEQQGMLTPFIINSIRLRNNGEAIVSLEDVGLEEAQSLTGKPVYLPLSMLPPLSGNRFYYHEVIGFRVVDAVHGDIGVVQRVLEIPRQALLQIDNNGKEVLVPVADDIISSVDRESKTIHVELPEGLLDIYL